MRLTAEARDFRRLRTLATEMLEQCGHYERNTGRGEDDAVRGLLVQGRCKEMAAIGRRLKRRYLKTRGEK